MTTSTTGLGGSFSWRLLSVGVAFVFDGIAGGTPTKGPAAQADDDGTAAEADDDGTAAEADDDGTAAQADEDGPAAQADDDGTARRSVSESEMWMASPATSSTTSSL